MSNRIVFQNKEFELLSNDELQNLSLNQRKEYFKEFRNRCVELHDNQLNFGQNFIKNHYKRLINFKVGLYGDENVPKDVPVIFVINHTNSHDIPIAYNMMSMLNKKGSVMVATDCLNPLTNFVFYASNATTLDRLDKYSRQVSIFKGIKKLTSGYSLAIFGESTWNNHPIKLMQHIKNGCSIISGGSQAVMLPVNFEYIENDGLFVSEQQLYDNSVVKITIGRPIEYDYNVSTIDNTNIVETSMVALKKDAKKNAGIYVERLEDVDPMIYANHSVCKMYKAFGFTFNPDLEDKNLLFLPGEAHENGYHIENGVLVPGSIKKEEANQYILSKKKNYF